MISKLDILDWAHANAALSTNHKPVRQAYKEVALGMGISEEEFEQWAKDKEWKDTDAV